MKLISLIGIFCLYALPQQAQTPSAASFAALSDAATALGGIWSLNANQSGLLDTKGPVFGINYNQPFRSQKINAQSALLALPFRQQSLGISLYRYGFETYKEQELQLAYARAFGPHFSAALSLHWHHLQIKQYGGSGTYSLDAGMQYRLNPNIRLAAHISNLSNNAFEQQLSYAAIPLRMQLGLMYQMNEEVLLAAAYEQHSQTNPALKLGLEYRLIPLLVLRAGCRFFPLRSSAGLGLHWKSLELDMAYQAQGALGHATQIGLAYAF